MRHHYIAQAAICLMLVLLLLLSGCGPKQKQVVFVITQSESGYYWENLLSGARLAAQDNGYSYTQATISQDQTLADLYAQAEAEQASLLVLALDEMPIHYSGSIPLCLLGDCAQENSGMCRVSAEEGTIGKRIGQLLAKYVGMQKNILLLSNRKDYELTDEWEVDLRYELGAQGSRVAKRIGGADNVETAAAACKTALEQDASIACVVARTENLSIAALNAIQSLSLSIPVVAADYNDAIAQALLDGTVVYTTVRPAYAYGYMGVENSLHLLSGRSAERKKLLDAMYVTPENMFSPDLEPYLYD